jgi:mRNA interferase MazF
MLESLFDKWNTEKQKINTKIPSKIFINSREIWFTKMGQNIGFEENGKKNFKRPVLVIKKIGNLFFTVALTTKGKLNSIFYHKFTNVRFYKHYAKQTSNSFVILSQVRIMDKKRFEEKMGLVSFDEFSLIKQKLTVLLL